MKKFVKNSKGFTLIEMLIVVTIIAILAIVVVVAVDPIKRLSELKNATRSAHINSLATAIHIHTIENKGVLPQGLYSDMDEFQIGTAQVGCKLTSGKCQVKSDSCINLATQLQEELPIIPKDPNMNSGERTGYSIFLKSNKITIRACYGENEDIVIVR